MGEMYIIGGGTCCGKSSVSRLICANHGLSYFQQDDHLYEHIQLASAAGDEASTRALRLSPKDMWLREPQQMCHEEMEIYAAILGYSFEAVRGMGDVLMEGAGFIPGLMSEMGIAKDRYVCMAPTREFRLEQYSKRDWMHEVLDGVGEKEQAFANWMERDALMADESLRQAGQHGYHTLIIDGSLSIEQTVRIIEGWFGLG